MRYKIGDKVIIHKAPDDWRISPGWNSSMNRTLGEVGKVSDITYKGYLRINTSSGWWNYRPEWVRPSHLENGQYLFEFMYDEV